MEVKKSSTYICISTYWLSPFTLHRLFSLSITMMSPFLYNSQTRSSSKSHKNNRKYIE